MNSYDVKRLALVYALIARLESMKIANIVRANSNEAPDYGEQDFTQIQGNFEDLANGLDELL